MNGTVRHLFIRTSLGEYKENLQKIIKLLKKNLHLSRKCWTIFYSSFYFKGGHIYEVVDLCKRRRINLPNDIY